MPQDDLVKFINLLGRLNPVAAVALVVLGAVFLSNGWKFFKALVVLDAAFLGVMFGAVIGGRMQRPYMEVYLGIGGGAVFAALAWPLMKGAVSVLGAVAGAAVGFVLWRYAVQAAGYSHLASHAWAGAVIGLIAMGLLTFALFQTTVIVAMAMQGSAMLISGLCALLLRLESPHLALPQRLAENTYLLPLLVLVPGILGVIFQQTQFLHVRAKKQKSAMAAAKAG